MAESNPQWMSIHDTAEAVGQQIWLTEQLFTLLGTLSPTVVSSTLKVFTATWSRRFGECSLSWRKVLPLLADPGPETFVTPSCEGLSEFLTDHFSVRPSSGPPINEELVAALNVVLAALDVQTKQIGQRASKVADSAVLRQSEEAAAIVLSAQTMLDALVSSTGPERLSRQRLDSAESETQDEWNRLCGE